MNPKISVITPSFNQGQYIERTIQSILSQNIDGLEYFVMDGGSTDETLSILRRYGDRVHWTSGRDRGQSDAINKGFRLANGDIVAWLNSDDIYYPGAINAVVNFFELNPSVDFVYGDAYHIDKQDGVIGSYYTEDWNLDRLKEVCYLCQPATFFRRQVIERIGELDDRLQYCMDYEYWLRAATKGAKFSYLRQTLAGSRLYKENKTLRARAKVHHEINNMLKVTVGSVPDQWIFGYAHAIVGTNGFQAEDRFRFAVAVAVVSLYAAMRWNKIPSATIWKTTASWVMGNMRTVLRERFIR